MPRGNREGQDEKELEELAGYLNALGHPRRLELLGQLRVPRTLGEIHLKPWRKETEGNPDRAISRNAVQRHLLLLKAIGVVAGRDGSRDGRDVEEYVLQHARVFQVVEELRGLTQLRPRDIFDLDATAGDDLPKDAVRVEGPHVVLLTGPFEGTPHRLEGKREWTLGRSKTCDISLDYDPFVSSEHALLVRDDDGFVVRDLPTNRNGTVLNWGRVPRAGEARLRSGDVLRVGRSLLLFKSDS